ncbi:hypothetical protein OAO18_05735 [Francisellaceae bacterium]|nr:hypothetical protein [Francisellaceae bacterium]
MCDSLWFFTDDQHRINVGSKPSVLASFVIMTRTESTFPFQEEINQFDLEHMGYEKAQDLIEDPDYHSKVRIYVRKKYSERSLDQPA